MTKLILTADWHLRDDTPLCRTDDYWEAQKNKIDFIFATAHGFDCPIIIAGDLGHRPKWSIELLNMFIDLVMTWGVDIYSICGQHDLIGREISELKKTGFGLLTNADIISHHVILPIGNDVYINFFSFGEKIQKPGNKKSIAVIHQMVIEDKPLWPGQKADTAKKLLKKHPEYDCIVSGDNHLPFVIKYKNRILINPGSMMRMTADQINHEPRIYLYDSETNDVKPIYLPIEEGVVSRKHIEEKQEREERIRKLSDEKIQAYVNEVKEQGDISLSFDKNLKTYYENNKVNKEIKTKIKEWKNG